jgi:hypothetical protein
MKRKLMFAMTFAALAVVPAAFADDTGTSVLSLAVAPEASFSTAFTGTTLTTSGGKFGAYSGTTNFTFKIRTSESTGSGHITVQVTDFATGGPAIADLSFNCTTASSGTGCSAGTAASSASAVNVVNFGAGAHSADAGDAGSVAWNLVNRTDVKTGSYTSTATFNISAL